MYKLSLFASSLLFAATLAAAPIACSVGTAAAYTGAINSAGGCTEDGLLFSNFNYIPTSSGTAVALPAASLAIAPLSNTSGDGLGFQIVGGFAATTGGVADGVFQYEVSTLNNSATLNGLSLTFNGTFTGSGIANTTENYCPGGTTVPPTTCSGGLQNIFVQSSQGVNKLSASATYLPVSSITVSKDIQVNGSTVAASTATISSVTNQFQTTTTGTVPEPASLLLLPGGLLVLLFARRKTRLS
ncbi:MAG TPA: PEP-CTERM sorting domain-containing protein [Bryobacteraceae bacterium]|nr:PEP-CTERM sorting domain-containing protein [Bryobacteraceae bacterium]